MASYYGIDLGSWRVRVAAVEGSFGRYEVRDAAQIGVSRGEDGALDHAGALHALREGEPSWEAADKAAAFPLDLGVVRSVRLPFSDRAAIAKALIGEVESQVPYDLDEMVLVTHVVEAKDKESRTTAFIAPRVEVRTRVDLLHGAKADPRTLTFDADALATYADRGVQVVVDIGHERTVLAVCFNGTLVAARLVSSGGRAFTDALMAATGWSQADAEEVKHRSELTPRGAGALSGAFDDEVTDASKPRPDAREALERAANAWCAEVRAELIALEDELGRGIDELLCCGGGSRLIGLIGWIGAETGVPSRAVTVPGGHAAEYALAVALARVAAHEKRASDLRVGEFGFRGVADTLWTVVTAAALGGGVAMVAAVVLFAMSWWDAQSRLAELDTKIVATVTSSYPDVTADRVAGQPSVALAILQEKSAESQARVELLGATISGVPPTLEMLKALSEGVPAASEARIDVRELSINDDVVNFKAETDSYETAARIEAALQKVSRFKQARKSDEKKTGETLQFTVNIPLGESEPAAEEG